MASRVMGSWRWLVAAIAALTVATAIPTSSYANDLIDVSGTVVEKRESNEHIVLVTDDLGRKNQPISIDMEDMSNQFEAVRVGQSYSLTVMKRDSNSYLAVAYVSEGSYVQRNDFGTQERFETAGSSIQSHVQNVPEDDESLSQQHRQNNLKRDEDDDHDNNPND